LRGGGGEGRGDFTAVSAGLSGSGLYRPMAQSLIICNFEIFLEFVGFTWRASMAFGLKIYIHSFDIFNQLVLFIVGTKEYLSDSSIIAT